MRGLTFKARLSLWFCVILGLSLLISGVVFSVAYFGISLVNLQNFMLRETREVKSKHFVFQDQNIYFKKDELGNTLSGYLRDEGLSALVLDNNQKLVASYGVYAGLLPRKQISDLFKNGELDKARVTQKQTFSFASLYDNKTYLVLISPVIDQDKFVGLLVLASDMEQAKQMLTFSLILLAIIIPTSLITGWLATHILVGRLFSPLEKILSKMKRVSVGALSDKIKVSGNSKDELVRLAVSYNEMLERLEEGVAKQKDFATKVSHELKTPLTQAVLNLDLVSDDLKSFRKKSTVERVDLVKKELRQFGELINSLLSLAKIKVGKVNKKEVTVVDLSKKIIEDHQEMINKKNQKVVFDAPEEMVFYFTDEQWKIIFSNLLSNAIKYGKEKSKIYVRIGSENGEGNLVVENQGFGLSRDEIAKVWDRFYRGKKNNKEEGLGIGLSLVKEVADINQLRIKMRRGVSGVVRVEVSGFDMI